MSSLRFWITVKLETINKVFHGHITNKLITIEIYLCIVDAIELSECEVVEGRETIIITTSVLDGIRIQHY